MQNQFPDIPSLADIARGDPIPGEWLTTLKNIVKRLSEQAASGAQLDSPVELAEASGRAAIVEQWLGRITSASPGLGTPGKAIYPVDRWYVSDRVKLIGPVPMQNKDQTFPLTVNAVNVSELDTTGAGTGNALPVGTTVHVFAIYSRNANQEKFYFFVSGGGAGARYAILTAPPTGNIATGHTCTDIAGNGSTTNTVRLNLENPALSAGPTFDALDTGAVVQYLPYSPTIGSGTNQIDGLIVAFHQWPIRGKVGQTPIITADSVGLPVTTRATWNVDYPVLHPLP